MHKFQRPIEDIIVELQRFLSNSVKNQSQIAEITGVDQSTVHRILHGKKPRKNLSNPLIILCNYAKIDIYYYIYDDPSKCDVLIDALRYTWDGSQHHARILAKIINYIGRLSKKSGVQDIDSKGKER